MSQPVGLTTRQHSSGICLESAGRLVVFVYLITCSITLWVRWGKNHYLLRSRSCPPISSYILLVSRGWSVLTPCKPNGIGYRNPLPVPIPLTLRSVVTITACRSEWQCLPDLQDPGQDQHSHYICMLLNAVSKWRLAECRCTSLQYLVTMLPLPVGSGSKGLLAACVSSVLLAFPWPWIRHIAVSHCNVIWPVIFASSPVRALISHVTGYQGKYILATCTVWLPAAELLPQESSES